MSTFDPPPDMPRYTAPRAEHLAWIHKTACELLKEWPALQAVYGKRPWLEGGHPQPDYRNQFLSDLSEAVRAAEQKTRWLCEHVAKHLPELTKRWPTSDTGMGMLPDKYPGLTAGDGGTGENIAKAIVELQAITDATVPDKQLTGKALEAANHIDAHPGEQGDKIARDIDVTAPHFRDMFRKKLKPLGYYNPGKKVAPEDRGYYPPKRGL